MAGRTGVAPCRAGHRTSYAYDPVFDRIVATSPRGLVTSYVYDGLYRIVEVIEPLRQIDDPV